MISKRPLQVLSAFASCLLAALFVSSVYAADLFVFPYAKDKPALAPLPFPQQSAAEVTGNLAGRLFKPDGAGPFPAVVLQHSCAGVTEHLRGWATEGVKRGYVVYVIDSLGPRGAGDTCGKVTNVLLTDGMVDVLQAAQNLAKLSFVDPKKITHVGFSWGGAIALFENSKRLRMEPKFASYSQVTLAAGVAVYPACYIPGGARIPEVSSIQPDVAVPTLALMPELEHEHPIEECEKRFAEAKKLGAAYEWQIVKGATHGWDAAEKAGLRTQMPWMSRGGNYAYDAEITQKSRDIVFDFLASKIK